MSVKSERRKWYAANVEAAPAGEAVGSPAYMAWVKRANAHMARICKFGTAELLEAPAPVEAVAPVVELKPVKVAPKRKPVEPKVKRGRVVTTPLKVPARVAPNAIVTVDGHEGRWLVLAPSGRTEARGMFWLQTFDGPCKFIEVAGKDCTIAGNGVAAAGYAAQTFEIAA